MTRDRVSRTTALQLLLSTVKTTGIRGYLCFVHPVRLTDGVPPTTSGKFRYYLIGIGQVNRLD